MYDFRVQIKNPTLPGLCMAAIKDSATQQYRSAPPFVQCNASDTAQWWSVIPALTSQIKVSKKSAQ
jgi:hypothetical protein